MTRTWRAAAGLFAGLCLLGGAASSEAAARPIPGTWSVAADRLDGAQLAARPLPRDGSFALAYEHSAYLAPAVELFAAAGDRFTMYGLASPNEAVLDYYEVAGRRTRVLGWWVLRLDRPQAFRQLPLIATPVGRRTLVVGDACVPLYPSSGSYDLRIRIRPVRQAGRTGPCPAAVPQGVRRAGGP
ncbi:MAG: hypothetical protein JWO67_6767 [Streptosporangiaceae bacterium]|jgi:hypothetical protein|nr:hypothetical protein [Streptosporangiaceae bacterium]